MALLRGPADGGGSYSNPIIPGNWSDPAVIRVGDDFYSACSTMGWQPGAAIMHSRDLLNWRYLGYAYRQHPEIPAGRTNAGGWGLEMGYNPNNKTYIVYAPLSNGRLYAHYSKDPAGPYKVKEMGRLGTDPGFFADEDGGLYLILSERAVIWRVSDDGLSTREKVAKIDKSGIKTFEGPDIFKRGSYYYLVYSGNGTAPHEGGCVGTMRAENLAGPWQRDPHNPQIVTDPAAEIQGPQHATLIRTNPGWWYVFYHAHELSYYSLGRQTCMQPVEWTDDGWWRLRAGPVPRRTCEKPDLAECDFRLAQSDEFDSRQLGPQWFFHCRPDYSGKSWSLSERPGHLRITTGPGDISSIEALPCVFLQRVIDKRFEFSTEVAFDAADGREAAGIHMYHDPQMNFWLVSTVRGGRKTIEVGKYSDGVRTDLWSVPNTIGNRVCLRITVDGAETASFHYGGDGKNWKKLGESIYFGDSGRDLRSGRGGDPDLGWIGPGGRNKWTAATFGVFAVRDGAKKPKKAYFDYIRVKGQAK